MPKTAPYFAALGYATLFGFSFMFTRSALAHIGPFHLLGLRFALAAFLLGALQLMGIIKINLAWADYKKLLPLAFFQPLLYFAAETLGVQLTSSSYAGMMIAIIPIFVTILARIVLNERPRPLQYPFIFVSVGGVLFIMAIQNRTGLEAGGLGSILLLGAVLSAALYNIASRQASRRYSPLAITWVMMLTGAIAFNAVALLLAPGGAGQYLASLGAVWPAVLYLGALSSVAAFFLINYSLSQLTATQAAVFSNLTTIISIAAGTLFLHEPFRWYHAVGAAAILTGIWGTNYFAGEKSRHKQAA